jgi:hypothetical protein
MSDANRTDTVRWQRVRLPPLERLVLSDIAERRGLSDEEALRRVIHEAAEKECRTETRRKGADCGAA